MIKQIVFPNNIVIEVGTQVEFEISKYGAPRWNYMVDRGGIDAWERGEVIELNDNCFIVKNLSRGNEWEWPTMSYPDYNDSIWSRPGYLKVIAITKNERFKLVDAGGYYKLMSVNQ